MTTATNHTPVVPGSVTRRTAAAGSATARLIWARRQRPALYPIRLATILALLTITTATAAVIGLALLALATVRAIVGAIHRTAAAVLWRYQHRHVSAVARHHATAQRQATQRLQQIRSELTTTTAPRTTPPVEPAERSEPTGQLPPWPTTPTPTATPAAQRPVVMTAPHYVQVPPPRHARHSASRGFWSSPAGLLLGLKLLVLWGLLYIGLIGCFVTTVANHNNPTSTPNPTTQEPTP